MCHNSLANNSKYASMMDDAPKQSTYLCELLLILLLPQLVSVGFDFQILHLSSLLKCHIQQQAHLTRSLPISTICPTWLEVRNRISPVKFKRMFHMPLDAFESTKFQQKLEKQPFAPIPTYTPMACWTSPSIKLSRQWVVLSQVRFGWQLPATSGWWILLGSGSYILGFVFFHLHNV
jgi:hypothetical protein